MSIHAGSSINVSKFDIPALHIRPVGSTAKDSPYESMKKLSTERVSLEN